MIVINHHDLDSVPTQTSRTRILFGEGRFLDITNIGGGKLRVQTNNVQFIVAEDKLEEVLAAGLAEFVAGSLS